MALAVRPYNPEGLAVIERIELHDGTTVTVDGRVGACSCPKPPARVAASTFHDGDSAGTVMSRRRGRALAGRRCAIEAGLAQAAFLFPLAHSATLRVALPLVPERRTRRRGLARRRVAERPRCPKALPSAEARWPGAGSRTATRGMRLELPDDRLAEAVDANRRFLLLLHDGDEITPGPSTYHRFWFRDAAYLLGALDRYGFHDEVAEVLRSYPGRQHADGFFFSQRQEWDANGAALHALAEHWRLTATAALVEPWWPTDRQGRAVDRAQAAHPQAPSGRDPALRGLLPAGISAEHLGPVRLLLLGRLLGRGAACSTAPSCCGPWTSADAAADAERFAAVDVAPTSSARWR